MTQTDPCAGIPAVLARMEALQASLDAAASPRRFFLGAYRRTTLAVAAALSDGAFADPCWVDRWDVTFAEYYLAALAAYERDPQTAPGPWRRALSVPDDAPALFHLLLGMNAHINYDLPLALLDVIPARDMDDPEVVARRHADHERIDAILVSRVSAEDVALESSEPTARSFLDHAMTPLNRIASRRFLREARRKVWRNTMALDAARRQGPQQLADRIAELEALAGERIADLCRGGPVLVRLGLRGFGVVLPGVSSARELPGTPHA